ncbi:hypothetical protein DOT_4144, partial [Desulfosporosinus sp. OT]
NLKLADKFFQIVQIFERSDCSCAHGLFLGAISDVVIH